MAEVLTVFRSRLRDDAYDNGYEEHAAAMLARAESMPGFVSFKSFVAADGERVSVIVFESEDAQQGWARDEQHRIAQQAGRDSYYSEYSITVGDISRVHAWPTT